LCAAEYRAASTLSALHLWVEAFEFDAGILGRKLPVHAFLGCVAPLFPLRRFLDEGFQIGEPPSQALQGQSTERDLGNIEPTAMFGSLGDRQPRGEPASLFWREGLLERAHPMGIEVITHQTHLHGFWVAALQQVSECLGPVHRGPMRCDTHVPRAPQRLRAQDNVRRPMPLILVVHLLRLPWSRGDM
jgi:hypothetical protein